jgi:hypothetical protein
MNNDAYAVALAEIEEDRLDKGVWARSFAESGGDESKAKATYIKVRAESIQSDAGVRVAVANSEAGATELPGLYASVIGEKNRGYYLAKFQAFDEQGPGLHASWNWAAFFFTGFWALYRRMYGWFFACVAANAAALTFAKVPNAPVYQAVLIVFCLLWLAFAIFADSLYYRRVKARIFAARRSNSDAAHVCMRLHATGGVLVWAPIVFGSIPVVGIVAAVALPAYQDYSKEKMLPVTFGTNDKVEASPARRSQIDEFLRDAPQQRPAAGQSPTPQFVPFTGVLDPSRRPTDSSQPLSRPQAASTAERKPVVPQVPVTRASEQERAYRTQVEADLKFASARAIENYPFLDTPVGKEALDKIIEKRDKLIAQGVYPALALTRAVNDFAQAYAPVAPSDVPKAKPTDTERPASYDSFPAVCRWVTPSEWSCK